MVLIAVYGCAPERFHSHEYGRSIVQELQRVGPKALDVVVGVRVVPICAVCAPGQGFRISDVVRMTDQRRACLHWKNGSESCEAEGHEDFVEHVLPPSIRTGT